MVVEPSGLKVLCIARLVTKTGWDWTANRMLKLGPCPWKRRVVNGVARGVDEAGICSSAVWAVNV